MIILASNKCLSAASTCISSRKSSQPCATAMDLQPTVLAWISSLPPDQQRAYMVSLQLAFTAEANNSPQPSASVTSLPLTQIEPLPQQTEEPTLPEESREWVPADEAELAMYHQHHQPAEPQAEPTHSEPLSASNPGRTEDFVSSIGDGTPREDPSPIEHA